MKHAKLSEKWKRMTVLQMLAHTMLLSEDFSSLLIQCCCLRISPEQREDLIDEACKAFRKMEEDGCPPDACSYNVIA